MHSETAPATTDSAGDKPGSGMRRRRKQRAFWAGMIGSGAISLLLAAALFNAPAPAFSGEGLLVTIGLVAVLGAGVFELRGAGPRYEPRPAAVLGIGIGFALIAFTDGGGTALIGALAAVAAAAHAMPWRRALLVAAPIVALINVALAVADDIDAAAFIWVNWGVLSSFVLGVLIREGRNRHSEARALLRQAELTRDAQAEAAMLSERGRIARELHDVLAHSLSALSVQLQGARLLAAEQDASAELRESLERAHRQARDGLGEARSAIGALRGEDLPGPEGLSELAGALGEERRIDCTYAVEGEPPPLSPQQRLALYRVGQEALTNVRKHSSADRVEVRVSYRPDGTALTVEDRRPGPATEPSGVSPSGHGIVGMGERAELLGGSLAAGPTGNGFRVELWLPRDREPVR